MKMMQVAFLVAVVLWVAQPAVAASVSVASDRMLAVEGTRTFVLGLYEMPGDDTVLDTVAAAGLNLVQARTASDLDRLQSRGMYAWMNTGACIEVNPANPAREQELRTLIAQFSAHPAMLVWEVPDEALWNAWYGALTHRSEQELPQLQALIAAMTDEAKSKRLSGMVDDAQDRFRRGDWPGSDQVLATIWGEIGEAQPRPDFRVSNAAERASRLAEDMLRGYELLRAIDPDHPVWMNHAPRNSIAQLAAFNRAADIAGCDIYPVPPNRGGHSDLRDRSLTAVGAYTVRMQDAAPGKPVFMVLQGFGWADLESNPSEESIRLNRRPTPEESRFMAFNAIVRGARGILYWGTHYVEKDSEFWKALLELVRELADLQPILSAPEAALPIHVSTEDVWGSVDRTVEVMAKDVQGTISFLVVNEWEHSALVYTIAGLDALDGVVYSDPAAGVEATVNEGRLTLPIRANGVHILKPASQ